MYDVISWWELCGLAAAMQLGARGERPRTRRGSQTSRRAFARFLAEGSHRHHPAKGKAEVSPIRRSPAGSVGTGGSGPTGFRVCAGAMNKCQAPAPRDGVSTSAPDIRVSRTSGVSGLFLPYCRVSNSTSASVSWPPARRRAYALLFPNGPSGPYDSVLNATRPRRQ